MHTRAELLSYLRRHRYAVQASIHPDGSPQAAIVGVAIGDDLTIVFDSLEHTRKVQNLRRDPRIALQIGGDDDRTVQLEGRVDFPDGAALEEAQALYFQTFPDGRDRLRWPGIVHLRVRPVWLRYTDYNPGTATIWELQAHELWWPPLTT